MMLKLIAFVAVLFKVASAAQECSVHTDFDSACKIGGLILNKVDENITVSDENCDALFKKQQFATSPNVTFPKAIKGQTYTLVCIDPDAPKHPKGFYYLHWIRANIPGEDLAAGDVSKGLDLVEYKGPAPPEKTGVHRYIFVVFRHSDPALNLKNKLTQEQRRQFNLADWILKTKSEGLICGPEAGVQFTSQFA